MKFARQAVIAAVHRGRRIRMFVLRRPQRAIWLCGVLGFCLAAMVGTVQPTVHDEFSYLLAGDTFARGRLTNPTHPMWRHFETFHLLQRPTYASKYPPGQGLAIALGIRLTGSPATGIWISCGLLIAALTWMLQGWVPPRWALWGGIAAALWLVSRHAFEGYWATSFWGGSVAATGGALVLGGVRRIARAPTIASSLAVGLGLAVLANSRPFEGLFFALAPTAVIGWFTIRHLLRRNWRAAGTTVAPMLAVLVLAVGLMAAYNKSVTGDATEFPYQAYYRTYDSSPLLLGQPVPVTPTYNVAEMERFYTEGRGHYRPPTTWREYFPRQLRYSTRLWLHYAFLIVAPVIVLPWILRGFWPRVALASLVGTTIALMFSMYIWLPHYAAPALGAIVILFITAVRFLSQLHRKGIRYGRSLTRLFFAAIALSALMQVATSRLAIARASGWSAERARIQRKLSSEGRHFVLVEYGPQHSPDAEWVFNAADIDGAPVVWGRSRGPANDSAFIRYFVDRRGWKLRITDDAGPFYLEPIPPQ